METSAYRFWRLEKAQTAHENTDLPTNLIGSVSFVDALILSI